MTPEVVQFPASSSRPEPAPLFGEGFHRRLAHWNRRRLAPAFPQDDWSQDLAEEHQMKWLERRYVEHARLAVAAEAAEAPQSPEAFVAWFEALKGEGPGENDPLFPWLAETASLEEMRWFLQQEVAGEAGFDDLVAMTQVKFPARAKLELAANYWDEMGRGSEAGMHGPMLDELARALALTPEIETTVTPALALGNTLVAFASTRRYAYHAIGALGAVELTAPWRAQHVADGLKRLGVGKERRYFALHATLDVKHSESWNAEVLAPLVAETPECARYIAEGALMRLAAGKACFEAYRGQLWDAAPQSAGVN